MELDKKRGAAVRALEALGYTYRNNEWSPAAVTVVPVPLTAEEERPEIHPLRHCRGEGSRRGRGS